MKKKLLMKLLKYLKIIFTKNNLFFLFFLFVSCIFNIKMFDLDYEKYIRENKYYINCYLKNIDSKTIEKALQHSLIISINLKIKVIKRNLWFTSIFDTIIKELNFDRKIYYNRWLDQYIIEEKNNNKLVKKPDKSLDHILQFNEIGINSLSDIPKHKYYVKIKASYLNKKFIPRVETILMFANIGKIQTPWKKFNLN